MNSKNIMYIAAIVIVLGIAVVALTTTNNKTNTPKNTTLQTPPGASNTSTQFNNSKYAASSYMIFPNVSTSSSAQAAMSDFKLSQTSGPANSTIVTMAFVDSNAVYNVTVMKGYKLYYIDTNLADDSQVGDHTAFDDGYVLVAPNGTIAMLNYPLPNA